MGVFATGVAVLTTAHHGQANRPRRDAMIPQEQWLVAELFDRLAKPESISRGPEAERLISDGTTQAPHAADTPDDPKADDDSSYADDDTCIE